MCELWIYLDDEWSTSGDVATVDVVPVFVVDLLDWLWPGTLHLPAGVTSRLIQT